MAARAPMLGLSRGGVLGLNARNGDYIMRYNRRKLYPLVDDKVLTKQVLEKADMPVPGMIGVVRHMGETGKLKARLGGREEFVLKPANGSGGDGILVVVGRRNNLYAGPDGRLYDDDDLSHHLTNVLSGLYSLGGQPDKALLEELVQFDPAFSQIAFQGVPDVRVIVFLGFPVMSMVRLPTRSSHGKANLHQGAVGAGICISSGKTTGGVLGNRRVDLHPDTGASVCNFEVPAWDRILDMASRCYEAVGLGYIGVDLVLDRDRGPLILELNARPGLNIQIANACGLRSRLELIESEAPTNAPPPERVAWVRERFVS